MWGIETYKNFWTILKKEQEGFKWIEINSNRNLLCFFKTKDSKSFQIEFFIKNKFVASLSLVFDYQQTEKVAEIIERLIMNLQRTWNVDYHKKETLFFIPKEIQYHQYDEEKLKVKDWWVYQIEDWKLMYTISWTFQLFQNYINQNVYVIYIIILHQNWKQYILSEKWLQEILWTFHKYDLPLKNNIFLENNSHLPLVSIVEDNSDDNKDRVFYFWNFFFKTKKILEKYIDEKHISTILDGFSFASDKYELDYNIRFNFQIEDKLIKKEEWESFLKELEELWWTILWASMIWTYYFHILYLVKRWVFLNLKKNSISGANKIRCLCWTTFIFNNTEAGKEQLITFDNDWKLKTIIDNYIPYSNWIRIPLLDKYNTWNYILHNWNIVSLLSNWDFILINRDWEEIKRINISKYLNLIDDRENLRLLYFDTTNNYIFIHQQFEWKIIKISLRDDTIEYINIKNKFTCNQFWKENLECIISKGFDYDTISIFLRIDLEDNQSNHTEKNNRIFRFKDFENIKELDLYRYKTYIILQEHYSEIIYWVGIRWIKHFFSIVSWKIHDILSRNKSILLDTMRNENLYANKFFWKFVDTESLYEIIWIERPVYKLWENEVIIQNDINLIGYLNNKTIWYIWKDNWKFNIIL